MSKETKHTPSPCFCCNGAVELNGLRFVCDRQSTTHAHIDEYPVYAAAPGLLEACQMFLEDFEQPLTSMGLRVRGVTLEKMRAAVKKATEAA